MTQQLTAQIFAVMYNVRVFENDPHLGPASDEYNILDFLERRYPGLYRKVDALDYDDYRQVIDGVFNLHIKYFPQDFERDYCILPYAR